MKSFFFVINTMVLVGNRGDTKRARKERGAVGGSVPWPWLRHPPSGSRTDQGESHHLMDKRTSEQSTKTIRGNREIDVEKKWVFYSPTY
jgi:hypothetical protein